MRSPPEEEFRRALRGMPPNESGKCEARPSLLGNEVQGFAGKRYGRCSDNSQGAQRDPMPGCDARIDRQQQVTHGDP